MGDRGANWFGVTMLAGPLAGGYIYNLTLVQLGAPDLGQLGGVQGPQGSR